MKRRNFLKLVGCAAVAPALPKASAGASPVYPAFTGYVYPLNGHGPIYECLKPTGDEVTEPTWPIRYPTSEQERQLKSRIHFVIK